MGEELLLPLPPQHRLTLPQMLEKEKGIGLEGNRVSSYPLMQAWLPVPAHKASPMKPFQQVSAKKTINLRENSVGFLQKSSRDRERVEHVGIINEQDLFRRFHFMGQGSSLQCHHKSYRCM